MVVSSGFDCSLPSQLAPDLPKPAWVVVRGAVDQWVAVVRRGRMLYEIADVPEDAAREALRRAAHKLSIPTRIVARSEEF